MLEVIKLSYSGMISAVDKYNGCHVSKVEFLFRYYSETVRLDNIFDLELYPSLNLFRVKTCLHLLL